MSTKINKECIIDMRPDREIRKTIISPGDYNLVPYEDARCKIRLKNVKCVNGAGTVDFASDSRIFGPSFDGNVIIGESDCFIDRDMELILQQMCCGEICSARLTYKNGIGTLMKDVACVIELLDVTEEQLVSDWSWARLLESAVHHKERGVQLVKDKRIVDGFRRFSRSLKMVVAIEPVNKQTIDEERVKEIKDLKMKLYNNLAHCQLQFQEYGAALELCSRALSQDPDNLKALYRRSIAYSGLHMYEEAWGDIQHALAIDPNDKASQLKANEIRPQTMESLESGRGVQVVTPGEEHTFALDEAALEELLLREDVRERTAVVVSVAGAFRKGKSFLLDFFLRYLHHKYVLNGTGEWLGSEEEPLRGFSWRGGSERDTTGLLLWSQPFKATLDNGEKVVIFLMDTQGTFDSESTVRDNATVFALSTMLSSVQIYNLSQNIEEDDLQHLQLFTDYGRLAQASSGGKPFQRLQLVVRDWSFPYEHPYGAAGGATLLAKRLTVHEGQHPELQSLRRHITGCFDQLACFLLPHPGLEVATSPHFDGSLKEISPEFKTSLQRLVPMLLAPENLTPKKIGGHTLRAKDLLLYFKSYMNIFNGTDLPEPKSILEATAEANNLTAVTGAREVYEALMEEACGGARPYLPPDRLRDEHARARDKALHAFHAKKKMGGDHLEQTYCDKLEKELEEQLGQYRARNEDKRLARRLGTALVLAGAALAAYAAGAAASALGLASLVTVANALLTAAVVLLVVWFYSRATGTMAELAMKLDEIADQVMQQGLQMAGRQAVSVVLAATTDDKKRT
ncbi:atlastin-like [Aricia agestis]|uniref:atlastin-like n=1 Tax=Aricia agestis TaxID=91739 RepID=UPI001C208970|nr:atlastin-like [Aricia agestis]